MENAVTTQAQECPQQFEHYGSCLDHDIDKDVDVFSLTNSDHKPSLLQSLQQPEIDLNIINNNTNTRKKQNKTTVENSEFEHVKCRQCINDGCKGKQLHEILKTHWKGLKRQSAEFRKLPHFIQCNLVTQWWFLIHQKTHIIPLPRKKGFTIRNILERFKDFAEERLSTNTDYEQVIELLIKCFNEYSYRFLMTDIELLQAYQLQIKYNLNKSWPCGKFVNTDAKFKKSTKFIRTHSDINDSVKGSGIYDPVDIFGADHFIRMFLELPKLLWKFFPFVNYEHRETVQDKCMVMMCYLSNHTEYFQLQAFDDNQMQKIDDEYLSQLRYIEMPSICNQKWDSEQTEIQYMHILIKHKSCCDPESWRCGTITRSRQEARNKIEQLRKVILFETKSRNLKLADVFSLTAKIESDGTSAKRDEYLIQTLKRGERNTATETVAFGLNIGQLSKPFECNRGFQIMYRVG